MFKRLLQQVDRLMGRGVIDEQLALAGGQFNRQKMLKAAKRPADAIQAAKRAGLIVPVVYNTNGYDSVEALRQIRGLQLEEHRLDAFLVLPRHTGFRGGNLFRERGVFWP